MKDLWNDLRLILGILAMYLASLVIPTDHPAWKHLKEAVKALG